MAELIEGIKLWAGLCLTNPILSFLFQSAGDHGASSSSAIEYHPGDASLKKPKLEGDGSQRRICVENNNGGKDASGDGDEAMSAFRPWNAASEDAESPQVNGEDRKLDPFYLKGKKCCFRYGQCSNPLDCFRQRFPRRRPVVFRRRRVRGRDPVGAERREQFEPGEQVRRILCVGQASRQAERGRGVQGHRRRPAGEHEKERAGTVYI